MGREWGGSGEGVGREWGGSGEGVGREWGGSGEGVGRECGYCTEGRGVTYPVTHISSSVEASLVVQVLQREVSLCIMGGANEKRENRRRGGKGGRGEENQRERERKEVLHACTDDCLSMAHRSIDRSILRNETMMATMT